eukprot:1734839-Pyramimonas_sp.AAC.1
MRRTGTALQHRCASMGRPEGTDPATLAKMSRQIQPQRRGIPRRPENLKTKQEVRSGMGTSYPFLLRASWVCLPPAPRATRLENP